MIAESPIGVFDSGVGGLTVVRETLSLLPKERIVYFADNGYLPYGSRSLEQIAGFARHIVRFLEGQGAKLVLAGCNMSSGAIREGLLPPGQVPLLGVTEPAARAAVSKTSGRVGVIGTVGTVKNGIYSRAVAAIDPNCQVLEEACPEFVPLVEAADLDSQQARLAVRLHLDPLLNWGMDTLVLGCTHYPFLLPLIAEHTGQRITVVDPAREVALMVRRLLGDQNALNPCLDGCGHSLFASGDATQLESFASRFLGLKIAGAEKRDVHGG
jgi:glutamate racemase